MITVFQNRVAFPPGKRNAALADEADFAMKYDVSRYPHFQKWLMASLERPKAKEARALRE